MKTMRKFLVICMIFSIFISNAHIVRAQDVKTAVATQVMDLYSDAMVSRDLDAYDNVFEDCAEREFFYSFMEWRFAIMEILDVSYSDFEYTIQEVELESKEDSVNLLINFNETHSYCNGVEDCTSVGLVLGVEIDALTNDYRILNVYLVNDEFYDYFVQQILGQENTRVRSVDSTLEAMIGQLHELKSEMDAVMNKQSAYTKIEGSEKQDLMVPMATGYSYSGSRGAAYANKYVSTANSNFYHAGADCTNFVSQCIWAAYGGWNTSMSNATMVNNISNKVRMTSTWYAGSGGGSSAWENVDSLWNYVVGNTGKGPKAYGHNNGSHYSGILPIDMCVGDVLQKSSNGSDYTHSMYVISNPGGSNPSYSEIVIAQHSSNMTKTVAEVLVTTTYMRHMQFMYNSFDS